MSENNLLLTCIAIINGLGLFIFSDLKKEISTLSKNFIEHLNFHCSEKKVV